MRETGPEPDRAAPPPGTRPQPGWAAPRPLNPDGTPAPGAFDPRSWWLRYHHRFVDLTVPDRHRRDDQDRTVDRRRSDGGGPGGASPPPGLTAAGLTAAGLTHSELLRRRRPRASSGWRRAVYSLSGGRVNPGLSAAEQARRVLLRRVRRHLPGAHHIAVSSMKGGVGKTTVSAVLGLTLAQHRGDRTVVVDANPDAGTLADRLTGEIGVTARQMLEHLEVIDSLTAVTHFTSLAGRLQVLASEQDPAMSEAFNREEYEAICGVLARFFNIIVTDSGTGLVHSAMEGTLALADSLVVVGSPTVDGASRASKTLDWLVAHGYAGQVADAVVVLSCDRVSREVDRSLVRSHFESRSRAVVEIPFDPHLATGGRLDLAAMRPGTRDAFLELGALIADRFSD